MLVECGGERFLVGGGMDTVETIVQIARQTFLPGTNEDEGTQVRVRTIVLLMMTLMAMSPASAYASSAPATSFWMKPAGRSSNSGRSGGAERSRLKTGSESIKPVAAAKGSESIAAELAENKSVPWSIVVGLTLLTLLPALLLSMTPLVRLLVVFHFLRQAWDPDRSLYQVLMGLALMMTWFLMQPVLLQVSSRPLRLTRPARSPEWRLWIGGVQPVKQYMLRYAREKDLAVFAAAGMSARPATKQDLPIQVVVPAYILSELKAGFQIGVVLFLPFLLVDLVVASVTTSIGMMQLPPVVVSTPLKILLFVMVDGWRLLGEQLIKSF